MDNPVSSPKTPVDDVPVPPTRSKIEIAKSAFGRGTDLLSRIDVHPVFFTALLLLAGVLAFSALPKWHEIVPSWWIRQHMPAFPFDIRGFVGWHMVRFDVSGPNENVYGLTEEAVEAFLRFRCAQAGVVACFFAVLFARFERRPVSAFPLRVLRNLFCLFLVVNVCVLATANWPSGAYCDFFSFAPLPAAGESVTEENQAIVLFASRISVFLASLVGGLVLGVLALFSGRLFPSRPEARP